MHSITMRLIGGPLDGHSRRLPLLRDAVPDGVLLRHDHGYVSYERSSRPALPDATFAYEFAPPPPPSISRGARQGGGAS